MLKKANDNIYLKPCFKGITTHCQFPVKDYSM